MREHWTQKRMQELTEENLRLLKEKAQATEENLRLSEEKVQTTKEIALLHALLAKHNITIDENSL